VANTSFHLDFGGPKTTPEHFFGISSASDLTLDLHAPHIQTMDGFFQRHSPRQESSVGSLTRDISALLIPGLSTLNSTFTLGEALHDEIKAIEESPKKGIEEIACKTAKIATEVAYNAVGTGVIVGGMPLLIAESTAFPPLALTIPVAAYTLPQVYANMTEFARFAGEKAEEDCHTLFRGF
jgi:hypothetical protein